MLTALREHCIDLVVTAGYMKKIGPATLDTYAGSILNIHPSLLPRHGGPGMHGHHVHESVLASGDTVSGGDVTAATITSSGGTDVCEEQDPNRRRERCRGRCPRRGGLHRVEHRQRQ
ncbi:hypothetical protein FE633_27530 [Streptomyces montanus]|uniref:phosphoribosylglycinamide formyltransferase 1 n=1 Tax=Streptomyces montanus TaxID=2580423 RepID=A0A5R9FRC4_9ACTN|nr:formyltransferase family protein [Streptomyces montanus]TLS43094.1 hypothetical protein FE633_27530 [Streptomyces montanus]